MRDALETIQSIAAEAAKSDEPVGHALMLGIESIARHALRAGGSVTEDREPDDIRCEVCGRWFNAEHTLVERLQHTADLAAEVAWLCDQEPE
jgi:hypothetical protein